MVDIIREFHALRIVYGNSCNALRNSVVISMGYVVKRSAPTLIKLYEINGLGGAGGPATSYSRSKITEIYLLRNIIKGTKK